MKNSYYVELLNIEKNMRKHYGKYNLHIICFPVYGFGTPNIVFKHILSFNFEKNDNVVIICSCAGFEGQSLQHIRSVLRKKEVNILLSDFIVHTYNWTQIINPQDKNTEEKVFAKADKKTIVLINKVLLNITYLKKRNILNLCWSWCVFILYKNIARRILGKTFVADKYCTNCGKCKQVCPVNAISIYNNNKPKWNWQCEGCQRCINSCPQKSIQVSILKLTTFIVLEIAPIFILIYINKHMYDFSIITNILIYFTISVIGTILFNKIIEIIGKLPIINNLVEFNYTKLYRRNLAKGFEKNIYH